MVSLQYLLRETRQPTGRLSDRLKFQPKSQSDLKTNNWQQIIVTIIR